MSFIATYRTGNGRAGLVGAESIVHAVFRRNFNDGITAVRNPLPASGAVEPESVADVRVLAPASFRKDLERAVTAEDYATLAQYLRFPRRDPRPAICSGPAVGTRLTSPSIRSEHPISRPSCKRRSKARSTACGGWAKPFAWVPRPPSRCG
jgi:hypothetical protein